VYGLIPAEERLRAMRERSLLGERVGRGGIRLLKEEKVGTFPILGRQE